MCIETLVQKIAELEASIDTFFTDVMMNNFSMFSDDVFTDTRTTLLDIVGKAYLLFRRNEIAETQNADLVLRARNIDMRLSRMEQHYYGYLAYA